ncbi:non-ribosomal peptide synthetase [Aquimarina intermedia]|uniref:Surfactin family lipopeptide synthetase A n=1 Tax=Aquimarina intermedia TaxID=350814 RepID=A0A5S5C8P7_9FLAO|nr:non-ribosomal peptide synthetase [Aquimarina intermedia]TYP74363.1 surfactin family lipopeptide synthetase A [Aquimarina intermedia]
MIQPSTLSEILLQRSNLSSVGITFIEGSSKETFLSYEELYKEALIVLAVLQSRGMGPADELVFQIEDNRSFIITFWGCILGGIIPVPLTIGHKEDHKGKIFNVWSVLKKPKLISSKKNLTSLKSYAEAHDLMVIHDHIEKNVIEFSKGMEVKENEPAIVHKARENDIAYIQFSSGSTGSPKGVILTHKNLISNVSAIANAASYSENDSMISWMPLTHDMGLIGFHINPLFSGMDHYLIPTTLFVRRPALWFDIATKYEVSILCSPNFGYKYILQHCSDRQAYSWNLSHVRVLYNGAEPISEQLCKEFLEKMEPYGLRKQVMCPVYGLAEASLAVSISRMDEELKSYSVVRELLNFGDMVMPSRENESVSFVNVGTAIDDVSIRITDHQNKELSEKTIGHVQIKGANVTSGYYNNYEATEEAIQDEWLKTGDLGFMKNNCLYITGRIKDLIIVNGQNYYPHDIESVAEEIDGIEINKIAVTGFFNTITDNEETVAFVFYRGKNFNKFATLVIELRTLINAKIGFQLDHIIPVTDIPRTTSGKLQRYKLLQQYQKGVYQEVEETVLQLLSTQESKNMEAVAPRNTRETAIYDIWQLVLGRDDFGINHKFFELGGTSLKAAQVAMLLSKNLQIELPIDLLYECPTIRELNKAIVSFESTGYTAILPSPTEAKYVLSEAQKNIFNAWKVNPKTVAYNIPVALSIDVRIQLDQIEKALNTLLKRHSLLLSVFDDEDEASFFQEKYEFVALTKLNCDPDKIEETLKELITPFELTKPKLFRFYLLEVITQNNILFLDFHHSIADGQSLQIFINEFAQLLQNSELSPILIDYKDYIHWENSTTYQEKLLDQESFWQSKLKEPLPLLELPIDFVRPQLFNNSGVRVRKQLSENLSNSLRDIATSNNTTLHNVLFTAYKWFLSKITGTNVNCIGVSVSGRTHIDLQPIFGMFVNSLPVVTSVQGDDTFLESLSIENKNLRATFKNQEYPFHKLVQFDQRERDVSRNNLFDTMFLFPDVSINSYQDGVALENFFFDPGYSKYDLSIELYNENSIVYILEYASALFRPETIANFQSYFEQTLETIANNPAVVFSELSLLSKQKQNEVIVDFNNTPHRFPKETVVDLFLDQVHETPNNKAICYGSYNEDFITLNDRSSKIAAHLQSFGVKKGDVVSVQLDKHPELIHCILGILKVGAVYLPIGEDLPIDRINFMLCDASCKLLICKEPVENLDIAKKLILTLSALDAALTKNEFEFTQIESSDLAYIIYTSGTTGRPKGVMISHKSLANYVQWAKDAYLDSNSESIALFTNIAFDLTLTSIFLPLCSGNPMYIYSGDSTTLDFEQVLQNNETNILKVTPSHLRLLLAYDFGSIANCRLKKLIVGGEILDTQLANAIHLKFGGAIKIFNEYGPTEATIGCMIYIYNPTDDYASVPIGKPIANTQIYLLDSFLQPVPTGIIGELFIAGDGLAKGYVASEDLTNEKFLKNPFIKGSKIYKTGDIAKRNLHGDIEYIGRADEQVKINGYRVELEEIKRVLLNHRSITSCVITTKIENDTLKLVSYYTEKRILEKPLTVIDLKNYLAGSIPHFMIPEMFIKVDTIPLTSNGKIDIKKLLQLSNQATIQNETTDVSQNEIFKVLKEVWSEVLKKENFSDKDSFYELGGDSIKATQIASKLQERNILVKVKEILTYNTLQQLGLYIISRKKEIAVRNKMSQEMVQGSKKLSPIEWWFTKNTFKDPGFYNQSIVLSLKRKVINEYLERAFELLIRHHDGLRLNYNTNHGDLFYNTNHIERKFELQNYSLADTNEDDSIQLFERIKSDFDISSSLLFKAAIIKSEGTCDRLFLTAHHLLVDGVSWRILLEDLLTIYLALEKEEDVLLPSKTASGIIWHQYMEEFCETDDFVNDTKYWTKSDTSTFKIPLDYETDDWQVSNVTELIGTFSKNTIDTLLKITGQKNVFNLDIQIVLFTAWALVLKKWTSQETIVIQVENNGRTMLDLDVSRTIGWFTTLFPLQVKLVSENLKETLLLIKEKFRSIPNQGIGYMLMQQSNNATSNNFYLPEVRFNYLGEFGAEFANELFVLNSLFSGNETSKNNQMTAKFEINMMIINGELQYKLLYNTKSLKRETVDQLLHQFDKELSSIIEMVMKEEEHHFSPSDFSNANLMQEDIDSLFL